MKDTFDKLFQEYIEIPVIDHCSHCKSTKQCNDCPQCSSFIDATRITQEERDLLKIKFCIYDAWNKLKVLKKDYYPKNDWHKGYMWADCISCNAHSDIMDLENNKAMSISPKKNIFYCFKCNAGGDARAMVSVVLDDLKGILESQKWLKDNNVHRIIDGVCENDVCIVKTS